MENLEQNEPAVAEEIKPSALHTVTPLSKYLAMILFVLLPFIGGWIGYTYAPEKVVEVERVVIQEVEKSSHTTTPPSWSVINQFLQENIPNAGNIFLINENKVYTMGFDSLYKEYKLTELEDIPADSFRELNDNYISDGSDVFYVSITGLTQTELRYPSFQMIEFEDHNGKKWKYASDGQLIYHKSNQLTGLDAETANFNRYDLSLYDDDTVWKVGDTGCTLEYYEEGDRSTYNPESQLTRC